MKYEILTYKLYYLKNNVSTNSVVIFNNDFSIIAKEKINYILEIKESLVILRDKPSLNKTIYTTPLYLYNS